MNKLAIMEPKDYLSKEKIEEHFLSNRNEHVNLFNELLEVGKQVENKIAVEDLFMKMDYKTLLISSYVFADKLSKINKNENRMGIILPNVVVHTITLFALFKIGKTPAILNFSLGIQTILECIDTVDLKSIITSKTFIKKANLESLISEIEKKVSVIYVEDIKESITQKDKVKGLLQYKLKVLSKRYQNEVILFTSGSEARPKGVVLTHENLYANVFQVYSSFIFYQNDKIFNPLPMFHSFGLVFGTFAPLLTGLSTFLYPTPLHFKEIPQYVFEKHATFLLGTPTFLEKYERYAKPHEFSTLRLVVASAESLKESVRDKYLLKHGVRMIEGYGCTEASPLISLNTPYVFKHDTVGKIAPGIQYRILPVEGIPEGGKLLVKGPNIMKGYILYEKGFIPVSEWYGTGDVVKEDEEGFITIISRVKRYAKIAGEMISLNLVEQLAQDCYKQAEFYAVSISSEHKGERVVLFTTLANLKGSKLKQFILSQKRSALYIPSDIKTIESPPLLGTGKVNYEFLKIQAKSLLNNP